MDFLNYKIICEPEVSETPIQVFGDDTISGNVIIRSSNNSQTLYIDGTGESGWPIYLGIAKSRGTQSNKLPVEPGDILGGLQVYARTSAGTSLGYSTESPLVGSMIYRMSEQHSSELMIAVTNNSSLAVKLILDSTGNLRVSGSIKAGKLEITDEVVNGNKVLKFVKVLHNGTAYAMPLYSIQETRL